MGLSHIFVATRAAAGQLPRGQKSASAAQPGRLTFAILAAFIILALLSACGSPSTTTDGDVVIAEISGPIDPLSARYLSRSVENAETGDADLLVVRLDTPGGMLSSTRDMVEILLGAEIPVAVYVGPGGAQAASAGTFVTASANFAAMAPGTNIGAASPVASGGEEIPATLARKINEDTAAFIRSVAEARGRNAEALEKTVTEARSYTAQEALELQIVDLEAQDLRDLLSQLDGRVAETAAGPHRVNTEDADIREVSHTLLEGFLGVVSQPTLVFVFLVLGVLGIVVELWSPGLVGPGVVGVVSLALAFLGMGNLPVNWIGVGLILFAAVLFYLEAQDVGLGVFGASGVASLAIGGLLLFGGLFSPGDVLDLEVRVNPWVLGVLTGTTAVGLVVFIRLARQDSGTSSAFISESDDDLVGQWGEAITDLTPAGTVWVAGSEWTATAPPSEDIRKGEEVKILGVYGEVLRVTRYEAEHSPDRAG